jgi:hypothetical protein
MRTASGLTWAGFMRILTRSDARKTSTDSAPGKAVMACWTYCVHSTQSMPATGTSTVVNLLIMGGVIAGGGDTRKRGPLRSPLCTAC